MASEIIPQWTSPIPNEYFGEKHWTYYYKVGDKIISSPIIMMRPGHYYIGFAVRQYVKEEYLQKL